MQINTSTNYAIKILLHLASKKCIVSASEISESIKMSDRYLRAITAKLRDGELVGVNMGPTGGYFLLKDPCDIKIHDIVVMMEGDLKILNTNETAETQQILLLAFEDLQQRIYHYLNALTLESLISKTWQQCLYELRLSMEPYYTALHEKVESEVPMQTKEQALLD